MKRLIIVLTILSIAFYSAGAAVIDDTGPTFEGDYLLVINTSTDVGTVVNTGTLPLQANLFSVSAAEADDGSYKLDPNNFLPKVIPTVESFKKDFSAFSAMSEPVVGDRQEFWTQNMTSTPSFFERFTFTLKYVGGACTIWLQNDNSMQLSQLQIDDMGEEFDSLADKLSLFGTIYDGDKDGRATILLYDIQDGFGVGGNLGYIGGFFWGGDLYDDSYEDDYFLGDAYVDETSYQKGMDIIHVDTYPSMGINFSTPDIGNAKSTVIHEYQHLLNYSIGAFRLDDDWDRYENGEVPMPDFNNYFMPIWLNEGLSMAAEHYAYGTLFDRTEYYNSSYIQKGYSLFDWGDNGEALPNYTLSYLFLQYLRTQTKSFPNGGNNFYKLLTESPYRSSPNAVTAVMNEFYPGITLDELQINFRIACMLQETSGFYGFMGESDFYSAVPKLYTGASVNLRGGSSIIMEMSAPFIPASNPNLKFIGFTAEELRLGATWVGVTYNGTNYNQINSTLPKSSGSYGLHVHYINYTNTAFDVMTMVIGKSEGRLKEFDGYLIPIAAKANISDIFPFTYNQGVDEIQYFNFEGATAAQGFAGLTPLTAKVSLK